MAGLRSGKTSQHTARASSQGKRDSVHLHGLKVSCWSLLVSMINVIVTGLYLLYEHCVVFELCTYVLQFNKAYKL